MDGSSVNSTQCAESILPAGAELAIAKLLVGEVVAASQYGSGLLVDCETGEWWCVVMGVPAYGLTGCNNMLMSINGCFTCCGDGMQR